MALKPYFVEKQLSVLAPTTSRRRHLEALLKLIKAPDYRANVAEIHRELFEFSTPASANASLNRMLHDFNETAVANRVSITMCITAAKKGARQRWVWFEGPVEGPPRAAANELESIPVDRLVPDQRGMPADQLPVVVLFTYNEHETAAVLDRFGWFASNRTETRDGITYNLLGVRGGMMAVHRTSRQGEAEAQLAAEDAFRSWNPQAMIGVGIAFGVNAAKQQIGDVLVSTRIRDYELARIGEITVHRGDAPQASHVLLQRFDHLNQSRRADPKRRVDWPELRLGPILTGNKLVDNADYRANLLRIEQEAVGGEMEALGLQKVCDRHRVDWIIVKAICDWADGSKDNPNKARDQRFAADNAALVVHEALALGNLYVVATTVGQLGRDSATPTAGKSKVPARADFKLDVFRELESGVDIDDPRGVVASLDKDQDEPAAPVSGGGVDVMGALREWAVDAAAPRVFVLLGEYGMGKTVTCQRLARQLDEQRSANSAGPMPLYFDLKDVTGLAERVPTLEQILTECMARGWLHDGVSTAYSVEQVYDWIDQGAVVIFDGLDEVLVKLTAGDGEVFTRTILGLLDLVDHRQRGNGRAVPAKVLISCRTQYFRTLRDQRNHFTGGEREDRGPDSARALVLLPFTDDQVLRYLAGAVPGADPARVYETVRAVHNLEELAHRPFTLKLVAAFVPEIEADRRAGRTVYGVTLYRRMAARWLERDSGKHHIKTDDKLSLAAHLAAHLWRTRSSALPAQELENWFHEWLGSDPALSRRYSKLHPEQLEEDLRTATFLTREDAGGESRFRFAHTSLQEFFLARYLADAIRADDPERWELTRPSEETLDFLGQTLAEANDPKLLAALARWRHTPNPSVNSLLLAYTLLARRRGWPKPALRGIQLQGASLRYFIIDGRPASEATGPRLLDLSEADFTGSDLRDTIFANVRADRSVFDQAQLNLAEFHDSSCVGASYFGARCTGATWRATDLTAANWEKASGYRPHFLLCPNAPQLQAVPDLIRAVRSRTHSTTRTIAQKTTHWVAGHTDWVRSCVWSPDGSKLATASNDGTARIWDPSSGEQLLALRGHTNWVRSCSWSSDGCKLATASNDGGVRIWDPQSGEQLLELRGHKKPVLACDWSPDGSLLATASSDGTARIWDPRTGGKWLELSGHTDGVTSCAWSPDGTRLATTSQDRSIRIWDPMSGEQLLELTRESFGLHSCCYSPDGTRLATSEDGCARVWDAQSGEQLLELRGHRDEVLSCSWAPYGDRLATASKDGSTRIWDADSGEQVLELRGLTNTVLACRWSPDGTRLATTGSDGSTRVWDADSGEQVLVLRGHSISVRSCGWSPDGICLATTSSDGSTRIWTAGSGELVLELGGHSSTVRSCAWSPDGIWLATTGNDGSTRIWTAGHGEQVLELRGHTDSVLSCAWSPDGTRLATTSDDGSTRIWDRVSGEQVLELRGHTSTVTSCGWSPDGTRLATTSSDRSARIWDALSGRELLKLRGHTSTVSSCAWSPDGTLLATTSTGRLTRIWDSGSGEGLLQLRGHSKSVLACDWSPDGIRLATTSSDGTARIWDGRSGLQLRELTGHTSWVRACAWSPDGTRLATTSSDGTTRIWDPNTGEALLVIGQVARGRLGIGGYAVWVPGENRVRKAVGDAWRALVWQGRDEHGAVVRHPLEYYGAIA